MGYYDDLTHDLLCKKCKSQMRKGNIGQREYICTNINCRYSNPHWEDFEFKKWYKNLHYGIKAFLMFIIVTFGSLIFLYLGDNVNDIFYLWLIFTGLAGSIITAIYLFINTNLKS